MLAISKLARYPFTKDALNIVKEIGVKIEELTTPEYNLLILRARERIEHAINYAEVRGGAPKDLVELLSFPTAIFLVSCLDNKPLARRFALAEAKRAYKCLIEDGVEEIKRVANEFSWRLDDLGDTHLRFGISFTNYLSNSIWNKESRWRLINRNVDGGLVSLTEGEAARLLQEEVRRRIEQIITESEAISPEKLKSTLKDLEKRYSDKLRSEPPPISSQKALFSAFPPCVKALYTDLITGKNLSHMGRFVLTSFLFGIGASSEDILKLFKRSSDFNLEKTRYQVEHIGGLRGSSQRYNPPKCGTLKTHGLCRNPDELCTKIPHPFKYYRLKIRSANQVKKDEKSK